LTAILLPLPQILLTQVPELAQKTCMMILSVFNGDTVNQNQGKTNCES